MVDEPARKKAKIDEELGLYPRCWLEASSGPRIDLHKDGLQLIVAQFNTLADGLSGKHPDKGGFTEAPPKSLEFEYRKHRLVKELLRHGEHPHIVAMEEVDHFDDWFQPTMASFGYEGRFVAKPNSPCKRSLDPLLEDGCALFWRKDIITLEELETMNYDLNGQNKLELDRQPQKSNQVAILATLRPVGALPIVVAVTHLAAPKTAEAEEIRADQITQLLDKLKSKGLECIVAMDMNATPTRSPSTPYPCLAYAALLEHSLCLFSVYAEALGAEPNYTSWKRRGDHEAMQTIDYICATQGIGLRRVLLPPEENIIDPERLPTWRYPSDHLALLAQLTLPRCNETS